MRFNNSIVWVLLAICAMFCGLSVSFAQSHSHVHEFDEAIEDYLHLTGATAATLAINRNRKLVFAKGYGYADRNQKVPTRAISTMRIASCTKPFTRVAIYQLISENKLAWNTKVYDFLGITPLKQLPLTDDRIRQITIEHLVKHQGGWNRAESFDPMYELERISNELGLSREPTKRQVVRFMWNQPLQVDPGTKSDYSNFGYMLLGLVIEKVTGESYIESIRRIIGEPLGIDDLWISPKQRRIRHPREVHYQNEVNLNLQLRDSASGLVTSAPSLCKFMRAYWMDGQKREKQRNMFFFQFGSHPWTTTAIMEQRLDGIDYAILLNGRRNDHFEQDNVLIRNQFNKLLDKIGSELPK